KIENNLAMNETLRLGLQVALTKALGGRAPENILAAASESESNPLAIVTIKEFCERVENGRTPSKNVAAKSEPCVPLITSTEARQEFIFGGRQTISKETMIR